jgi:putative heme-binding domain-containing protein
MHTSNLILLTGVAFIAPVRSADDADALPLSPQQQLARFNLPPGFEIQLVASEPEIQKPMNLNFDASGRLWVTGTGMYPFAAKTDALGQPIPQFDREWDGMSGATHGKKPEPRQVATDTLRILDQIGPDGKANRITLFAEGLNIPIGVQPLPREKNREGDAALVFSIPAIWKVADTDGDGRADRTEKLYGDFGFRDTHGMSSNYLYWTDGWIYACHGFANQSDIRDGSGNITSIHSGSIYRFRPDGSKFELFGHGQTNPFGLTMDDRGNLYSCDSHSKPAYLILRGAHCEGIGKNHDGLGFLPPIMHHSHGSSAIAGIAHYSGDAWPEEYRHNLFIGNPVTRRINRDRLEYHGATPTAVEMPDFLSCDDPWFRPVQVKLGPDGALYIADFYNPIIGHYEHPLFDNRRDQARGRIWRVVWKGDSQTDPAPLPNLTTMENLQLTETFTHPNLEVRRLAKLTALARGLELPEPPTPPSSVLGSEPYDIASLLEKFQATPPEDTLTRHAIRVALRDLLAEGDDSYNVEEVRQSAGASRQLLAEISLAVQTGASARFVLNYLLDAERAEHSNRELFHHVLRHLLPHHADLLIPLSDRISHTPATDRLAFAEALVEAPNLPSKLADCAYRLAMELLIADDVNLVSRAVPLLQHFANPEKMEPLAKLVRDPAQPDTLRASALAALRPLPQATEVATEIVRRLDSPMALARQGIALLGESTAPDATEILLESLVTAPSELAISIATQLAASDDRATKLLDFISSGKASPFLLRHSRVAELLTQRPQHLRDTAAMLAEDLPPENELLDQLIAERAARFANSAPDHARGSEVFATHCSVCHKFKDIGGNIAPNLDGVGASRGAMRLIEDILDPSRNVDPAFRTTILKKSDGSEISGMNLRKTSGGYQITLVDGGEIELPEDQIAGSPIISNLSLMPPLYEHILSQDELEALVHFLLQP